MINRQRGFDGQELLSFRFKLPAKLFWLTQLFILPISIIALNSSECGPSQTAARGFCRRVGAIEGLSQCSMNFVAVHPDELTLMINHFTADDRGFDCTRARAPDQYIHQRDCRILPRPGHGRPIQEDNICKASRSQPTYTIAEWCRCSPVFGRHAQDLSGTRCR